MANPYPWKHGNTSENTAAELDPRYETPLGAQEKADKAEQESKAYTDALDDRFKAHAADQTVHVTQTDHNKLDGIEWGAEVNQNAYTVVNGIPANAPMTELKILQGIGVRITQDPDDRAITITATGPFDPEPIPLSKVYDAGNSAYLNAGTAAGNVPVLDENGKLDAVVVPAIAVTDTFVVATQADMLALTVEKGDVAIRTDINKSFILKNDDPTVLASWQELLTPMSPVQSVAGKTGVVTLTKADVGLGNVTNESKATMFTNPALTGTPTAPTAAAATNNTQVATTGYVKQQGYLTWVDFPFTYLRSGLLTLPANPAVLDVPITTVVEDSYSMRSGNTVVVPLDGWYSINLLATVQDLPTTSRFDITINQNGTLLTNRQVVGFGASAVTFLGIEEQRYLAASDVITFKTSQTGAGTYMLYNVHIRLTRLGRRP
ncbi:hypothetical protein [Paenibacillus sp. Aloe-11]|uniref:hypothetical protein n=1 Tax=Paenibacillus sp. Aloe-11 TaxID=1050222 RepID=UPI00024EFFB4|nr:hypothetical protein [Paenibacillus sp. Aloe-11]EHS59463.1 hypothetical protein WG8_0678 [Paenibacillus sp. Aloe-11]